jgi:hypothetical protein
MKKTYLFLAVVLVLAGGGVWFGRMAWRVRHQLVTLHVRNAPLAEVLKAIGKQTRTQIRAEQGVDTRVTLRVSDKPLADVLDRIAEQTGARWSTVYAVYDSPRSLTALEATLGGDGKLETAGWVKLAPTVPEFKEPGELGLAPGPGADLETKPLPPGSAPGQRVIATDDVVIRGGPGPNDAPKMSSQPQMVRVFRRGGPGGNVTEQEVWSPEELVMESALKGRLGNATPEYATRETAAQTAQKINGRWTTYFAFRKSKLGFGPGGMPPGLTLNRDGKGAPMGPGSTGGAGGAPPPLLSGPPPENIQQELARARNEEFARLTPEQRVERARAKQTMIKTENQ